MINNCAKTVITMMAVVIFFTAISTAAAQNGGTLKIRMGVHVSSSAGGSAAQFYDIAKGLVNVFKDKYNVEINMKTYSSESEAGEALLKNELDLAVLWPGQVVEIVDKGARIHPWATYQVKKQGKTAWCFWQRKDKKALNVSDVPGKRMIVSSYNTDWLIQMRDYLSRNGIDKPLWKVFSSFTSVSGSNSAFMAMAAGDADFQWASRDYESVLKFIAPNLSNQVSCTLCSDTVYARGGFVLNERTLSEAELKKLDADLAEFLKDFNELAKIDSGIKALKQYMNLLQARIVPAMPGEFDYEIKLYKDARKSGWVNEAEFIIERMKKAPKGKPVEINPDFDYCQKTCPSGKKQMVCIDKCME